MRLPVVFPVHPRTRKMIGALGPGVGAAPGLQMLEPVGYHESLNLTESARLVVTDSGGLQEESTFFRTPCLTLRPNTERPITITVGSNRLTTPDRLPEDVAQALAATTPVGRVPELWDGQTAGRILDALLEASGRASDLDGATNAGGAVDPLRCGVVFCLGLAEASLCWL